MAIASVIQKNGQITAYDENNRMLFQKFAPTGGNTELMGYTSSTVTIKRAHEIIVYDDRGNTKSQRFA
ncbi:MAG: hypothetical protein LBC75_09345 [Fibromonadaceae bacterium]|nr:hypothetical protein [Fibromonadaceae bacterium]